MANPLHHFGATTEFPSRIHRGKKPAIEGKTISQASSNRRHGETRQNLKTISMDSSLDRFIDRATGSAGAQSRYCEIFPVIARPTFLSDSCEPGLRGRFPGSFTWQNAFLSPGKESARIRPMPLLIAWSPTEPTWHDRCKAANVERNCSWGRVTRR